MNEADRQAISSNTKSLVQLIQFYEIHDLLVEHGVFTKLIMDHIKHERNVTDRMIKLLEELPKRGPEAFEKFINILKMTNQLAAVRLLRPNDVRAGMAMENDVRAPSGPPLNQVPVNRADQSDTNMVPNRNDIPQIRRGNTIPEVELPRLLEPLRTNGPYFHRDCYIMNKRVRGICLIINNVNFQGNDERFGSDKDAHGLDQVFRQLHFEVDRKRNQSSQEMKDLLTDLSRTDHSNFNALVVIILSHGLEKGVLGTDGVPVPVEDIYRPFTNEYCPTLINKPKLFFIQACRGLLFDGITVESTVSDTKIFNPGQSAAETNFNAFSVDSRMSRVTDIAVSYSTIEGYISNRSPVHGTWYGRALCDVLIKDARDTELNVILSRVEEKIRVFRSEDGGTQATERKYLGWKKNFYFNPGHQMD